MTALVLVFFPAWLVTMATIAADICREQGLAAMLVLTRNRDSTLLSFLGKPRTIDKQATIKILYIGQCLLNQVIGDQ